MIHFYKFHGNGNDFILIDNRKSEVNLNKQQINKLCNRRTGIGADGLIQLRHSNTNDFKMDYYNSDGNIASMCGNGGRCIVAFANMLGIKGKQLNFEAYDGVHSAIIESEPTSDFIWDISLQLSNINSFNSDNGTYFIDTGSPHHIEFVSNINNINVETKGKEIRNSNKYKPYGTNVNFVEIKNNSIFVRTFERGVECETLSCGTGVTASAIATYFNYGKKQIPIKTKGGDFTVNFEVHENRITDIWLRGPAQFVFEGDINN